MITTIGDLKKLVARARETDAVALDTEFVWERTYYPQLGLIQIALSDEDCALIDPLAISDLSPLGELLSDRSVVKILHDAPQDLAILYQVTGTATQNVFDTRLAAGFSDLPATMSLCKLIKKLLDIDLPKTETRTNWLQRPLDSKQVEYALDDVRYLRAVRVVLMSRIIGPKIKSWLQEELNLLNNPQNYLLNDQSERYRKVRGAGTLSSQSLAILQKLYSWREEEARTRNKPRGHIVSDTALVTLARKKLDQPAQLQQQAGVSERVRKQYGPALLTMIAETLATNANSYPPQQRPTRLSAQDKVTFERLQNLISLKSKLLGIDPALIGNSSELRTLANILSTRKTSVIKQLRQTQGWRKNFLEDFFHQNHSVKT